MAADPSAEEDVDAAEVTVDEPVEEAAPAVVPAEHLVDLPLATSDAELSFDEALTLSGRYGVQLVVPMGEIGVGKTTIMVELWTQLVGFGAIGGYRFAGSRTAMAFEERAYMSRMAAGVGRRSTARTHYEENEGLLDLRVARPDGVVTHLLFADFSGERYERIREGAEADVELPWLPRADRIIVVVNGAALSASHTAEIEADRAARLLHAGFAATTIPPDVHIAIVVARDDELDAEAFDRVRPRLDALVQLANKGDKKAVLLRVAARPRAGGPAYGLDSLLDWICADDEPRVEEPVDMPLGDRAIARLREKQ